ncbi:MAG: serine hydrolase, partial [Xanthobacteraceae bacterium]
MAWVNFGARGDGLRRCLLGVAAIAAALTVTSDAAMARRYHRVYAHSHHHASAAAYDPPYASIVVDGNSGAVLESANPDALRHPASLTKVMTLYLLFERLDAGKIKLDTSLAVSAHASEQDPTKLGLKPGQTIKVEDAIKGIVTRSANDAAVVIAENLGGSEGAFAKLMTQKARALGMAHTTYVNASGLPDDDQLTTARDQALLGRAIQDRFPRYYKYFSTQAFEFHGETIRGHDHLLTEVDGVDGIKTGFTQASGFNLLTSLHRDGRYLVAVVLGGPSASIRDARMRELIAGHIKEASLHRTAPMIADASVHHDEPLAFAKSPMAASMASVPAASAPGAPHATEPASTGTVNTQVAAGSNAPIRPVLVRTISYRTVPVQTAALAPMPMLVPIIPPAPAHPVTVATAPQTAAPKAPETAPAQAAIVAQPQAAKPEQIQTVVASAAPGVDLKAPDLKAPPPAQAAPPVPARPSDAAATSP